MLTILKRFEIWLLFALVGAATWWALKADPNPVSSGYSKNTAAQNPINSNDPNSGTSTELENQSLLEVKAVTFEPDQEGGLVEVTLLGRSGTDQEVALTESNVEMLTSEGDGIRRFFVPFDTDPKLNPNEASLVTLKYWLTKRVDVLWLTYRDQTVKVVLPPA